MSIYEDSPLGRSVSVLRERGPRVLAKEVKKRTRGAVYAPYWEYEYGIDREHGFRAASSTEFPVFRDLLANLHTGDVFYDVGAYTGLFTLPVADVLPPGHVVAFEPSDEAAALESSLEEAGLDATVVQKAVSAGHGADYYTSDGIDRVGLLGDDEERIDVPTIDGTEVLASELPLPTVVKIDVFGAEVDVVTGLEPVLERTECRLVYCELHLPTSFQRKRPETVFENFLDTWSFTEIVRTLYRCGFEVEPMYLRSDTHDLFIRAYRPETTAAK
ncbi:FkbM family methyltransferase [Salinigranum halophilum]|uniref:FkbM family methyltransferase n=1 Tax=Salinigranum halophilum TaxID=2565931 RepID=UPI0010A8721A|nr:FkbM family methyltransferase [Salinigranum halophilum]